MSADARATGGGRLDRKSPLPLWAQLRDDLATRMSRAEFGADGSRFPGENALSAEYGVSRHTVRQALHDLRSDGLLVGGRGRPPRATTSTGVIHQNLGALYSLYASINEAGHTQRSEVRTLEIRRNPQVAQTLRLGGQAPLLYLERIRFADDVPLAHDRAWLPGALAVPLLDVDFSETALYAELADRCGITLNGGREQIHAVLPDPLERELLGLDPSTATLVIERIGELDGAPIELRRTVVRGDRFALGAEFSRSSGYRMSASRAFKEARPA